MKLGAEPGTIRLRKPFAVRVSVADLAEARIARAEIFAWVSKERHHDNRGNSSEIRAASPGGRPAGSGKPESAGKPDHGEHPNHGKGNDKSP